MTRSRPRRPSRDRLSGYGLLHERKLSVALLLAWLLSLAFTAEAKAQTGTRTPGAPLPEVGISASGGALWSTLAGENVQQKYETRPGWLATVALSGRTRERIGYQLELAIGQRGATEVLGTAQPRPFVYRSTFVQFPILVRVNIGSLRTSARSRQFYVVGGLSPGRRVKNSVDSSQGRLSFDPAGECDAVIGGGLDIGRMSAQVRYSRGLVSFSPADRPESPRGFRTVSVLVGYWLR